MQRPIEIEASLFNYHFRLFYLFSTTVINSRRVFHPPCRSLSPSTRTLRTSTHATCTWGFGTTGTGPSAASRAPRWTWWREFPMTTTGPLSKLHIQVVAPPRGVSVCVTDPKRSHPGIDLSRWPRCSWSQSRWVSSLCYTHWCLSHDSVVLRRKEKSAAVHVHCDLAQCMSIKSRACNVTIDGTGTISTQPASTWSSRATGSSL